MPHVREKLTRMIPKSCHGECLRYQKLVLHTMLCINVYVNVDILYIYILLCRVFVKIKKKWKSPAKLCSLVSGDRRKWLICEPRLIGFPKPPLHKVQNTATWHKGWYYYIFIYIIENGNNGVTIAYTDNPTRYKIYCMNHHELAWTIFHRGRNLQTNTCKTSTLENCISHRRKRQETVVSHQGRLILRDLISKTPHPNLCHRLMLSLR